MATSFSKDWKVKLNLEPEAHLVCVSLYDLLFVETAGTTAVRYGESNNSSIGFALPHDIIAYNTAVYIDSNYGEVTASQSYDTWKKYGIELCGTSYDSRAKRNLLLDYSTASDDIKKYLTQSLYFYEKSAALMPASEDDIFSLAPWEKRADAQSGSTGFSICSPVSVGADDNGTRVATIVLADKDTVFNGTITTETDFTAYSTMCLNTVIASSGTWAILTSLLSLSDKFTAASVVEKIAFLKTIASSLKKVYVWIRAPFFADYVSPDDFGQNLNPDSDVVHRNIMASADGDFNRYDASNLGTSPDITDADASEETRPYIAKTSPLIDFVSSAIFPRPAADTDKEYMAAAMADAQKDSSLIGAIPTESMDRQHTDGTSASVGSRYSLMSPSWFDPAFQGEYDTVLPFVPKSGNGYFDGRILSPTIDEIWTMLKLVVCGRPADTDTDPSAAAKDSGAAPSSSVHITGGLTVPNVRSIPFYTDASAMDTVSADPVSFVLSNATDDSTGKTYQTLAVDKYISNPDRIVYALFDALQSISDLAKTNAAEGQSSDISDFLPYANNSTEDSASIPQNTGLPASSDDEYAKTWLLNASPLSLRELESRILNLKYNLVSVMRYMKQCQTYDGKFGKTVITGWSYTAGGAEPVSFTDGSSRAIPVSGLKDGETAASVSFTEGLVNAALSQDKASVTVKPLARGTGNVTVTGTDGSTFVIGISVSGTAAGSLFQMHRSYNGSIDNPNTYFGAKDGYAVFDDTASAGSPAGAMPEKLDSYGASMPDKYSDILPSDVYLAADGEWHYVSDHVRLPILAEDY